MKRVLVIFSHPSLQNSRANSQLLAAIKDLEEVYVHDLYQHYPDMFIDVKQEQALLEGYDIIVFQHPFYWYSCPAIMKEWMDMVLTYGYAYGQGGQALKDKQWLSVLTTGGAPESYCQEGYNRRPLIDFLLPFQQASALCSMQWLPPFVLHGFDKLNDVEALRQCGQEYRQLLMALRDEQFSAAQLADVTYLRDLLEGH